MAKDGVALFLKGNTFFSLFDSRYTDVGKEFLVDVVGGVNCLTDFDLLPHRRVSSLKLSKP